ncbi:MAG: N-acetyl-gamma-glutamyl-phosphate reductase [Chitinivibrionia bacterium]|nr:N-acetyl-gamma-glutamyl-phosphate reductase [Chitinivibrionia bacterium]
MKRVFIDGQAGTTGLKLLEILKIHPKIELVEIAREHRKDIDKKKELYSKVDLTILCLPDEAAKIAVKEIPQNVKILDTSTAHRTENGWIYGFPEIKIDNIAQRQKIKESARVANPGCHATGAISIIHPLICEKIAANDYPFFITSITGYSGGGRKMIESHQNRDKKDISWAVRPYALGLNHKHIPEIMNITGLKYAPIFYPIIADVEQGMLVSVGIENRLLQIKLSAQGIYDVLKKYYDGEKFVKVLPFNDSSILADGVLPNAYLTATNCNNTNKLEIMVFGNETQTLIIARLDNLGKGASGAAVQNLNLMLGFDENDGGI